MHDEQVVSKKDVNIMIVVRIAYLNKHNTDVTFSLSYILKFDEVSFTYYKVTI